LLTGLFVLLGATLLATSYALVKSNLNISDRQVRQAAARKLGHPLPQYRSDPDLKPAGQSGHGGLGGNGRSGSHAQGPTIQTPQTGAAAGPSVASRDATRALLHGVHQQLVDQTLHRLLTEYLIGMGLLTLLSGAGGWLLAGRVLRPLKRITRTAQAVSQENLHQRIALDGPEDELKELADTFDHMLGRLDAAFGRQRAFVSNASHELRTPLTIIRTEADVALDKRRPDVGSLLAGMGSIRTATERSERLIDGLLTLARVDRQESHREVVALDSLAAQATDEIKAAAARRSISVTTGLQPASVLGDTRLLETLLRNLLENAVRHNQPGGSVTVRSWHRDETAVLEVENSGEIISPEQAGQLTEPFQRLHRHHQQDGVGLGLSIVSAIVGAHDGKLVITPRDTGGLQVRVRFRATRSVRAERHRPAPRPAGDVREPTVPQPRTA
jgi:signal transduction histidine kinase